MSSDVSHKEAVQIIQDAASIEAGREGFAVLKRDGWSWTRLGNTIFAAPGSNSGDVPMEDKIIPFDSDEEAAMFYEEMGLG